MEFPPAPESSRASSDVPFVTAAQASALLKSGLAISNELIGAAFPEIAKTILDESVGQVGFRRRLATGAAASGCQAR